MNKRIIIGNWKMNPLTEKEAEKLFEAIAQGVSRIKKTLVVVCPPFIYLDKLTKIRTRKIKLGAQDAFFEEKGAFTGEVSPEMLYNMGVRYTILGHSERRALGETNALVNKKIRAALASGLVPILCVGEAVRDENHGYFNLVKTQLSECLDGVKKTFISKIIIAYEPIWAISSTVNRHDASAALCREMAVFIRKVISDKFGGEARSTQVIYGGSVNEIDAPDFLKDGGIDGLLAGRTSLLASKFINIVKICEALNQ